MNRKPSSSEKLLALLALTGLIPLVYCAIIPYSDPLRCNNNEYFQFSSLRCKNCPPNTNRSADGLSCVCVNRHYFVQNGGGGDYKVACSACGSDEVTSQDKWSCVRCPLGSSGSCEACNASTAIFDKETNGMPFPDNRRRCTFCRNGTQPDIDRGSCKRCHSNVIRVTSSHSGGMSCKCPATDSSFGGLCFAMATVGKYNIPDTSSSYTVSYGPQPITSVFFKENLISSTILCCEYHNLTACQLLGNLCVMTDYNQDKSQAITATTDACKEFIRITSGTQVCNIQLTVVISKESNWREFMPWLYYSEDAEKVLTSTDISIGYKKGQRLRFAVAIFTPNGTFVGIQNDTTVFHLCQERESKSSAAFSFLTTYQISCSVSAPKLLNQRTLFYDLYYYVGDKLYPVPVLLQNYQRNGKSVNTGTDKRQWSLSRRFFIVDSVSGKTQQNQPPSVIRYAQSIQLVFSLRNSNGQIYPPYMKITYGAASPTASSLSLSFSTTYEMSTAQVTENIEVI